MSATNIEWTDVTWNPLRGCSKVSPGCKNCYAEKVAARFSGPGQPYEGTIRDGHWNGVVKLVPDALAQPLRWRKPRRVFVNSMSDLFHESVPFEFIAAVFGVMAACPQHTFQVLTKRPERAVEFFAWLGEWKHDPETTVFHHAAMHVGMPRPPSRYRWPIPNVWLGVSVEDKATADARIPHLQACPAAVRFVSYEPALAPVEWRDWWFARPGFGGNYSAGHINWMIVGGESGPGARPFDVAWARSTIAQCRRAGVPCFVKQMGAHVYDPRLSLWGAPYPTLRAGVITLHDRKGGDPAEWPADLRVREFPEVTR